MGIKIKEVIPIKKAETIIKEISKLERELYQNYNPKQVKEAIEKCEEKKLIPITGDDLISVLYEGALNELNNELLY